METFESSGTSSGAGQERWMEQRDLERDLQLAAELGKSLLERNKELECSLQQLYITNQDHVLEIEHLTRQLELLRDTSERHAQAYEHLDAASRDLELTNRRLLLEGRSSQQSITGLSEQVEGLQAQVEELQKQLEELRRSGEASARREKRERRRTVHGVPALHDIRRYLGTDRLSPEILTSGQDGGADQRDGEVQRLQRSVKSLSASLARERERRGNLDLELALALAENSDMDRRLADLEPWLERTQELEKELLEMSRIRLSEGERLQRLLATAEQAAESLLNGERGGGDVDVAKLQSLLGHSEADSGCGRRSLGDGTDEADASAARSARVSPDEPGPAARAPVSILSEVSEQYAALQARYEDLLARMHDRSAGLQHRAVQTAATNAGGRSREIASSAAAAAQETGESSDVRGSWADTDTAADCSAYRDGPDELPRSDDPASGRAGDGAAVPGGAREAPAERTAMPEQHGHKAERAEQPEYKALFQEIFMHIQKTRDDICAAKALRGTARPQHS